jgi:hypothetical protein
MHTDLRLGAASSTGRETLRHGLDARKALEGLSDRDSQVLEIAGVAATARRVVVVVPFPRRIYA